jgi:hypothetical protein
MSILLALAMFVPAGLALFHAWRSTQGLAAVARALRLDTTPLSQLTEGLVEVEGVITALDAPLVAASGRPAVFADVALRGTHGIGKSSRVTHRSHAHRSVKAALTAADGTMVGLDLDHVEVVDASAAFQVVVSRMEEPTRAWATDLSWDTEQLMVTERIVEPGARVVVSGRARVVDAVVDPRTSGYRDGVPVEKKTFVIGGSPEARLLVATGTARQLTWRALWPVVVLLLTALAGLAYAGIVLSLLLA